MTAANAVFVIVVIVRHELFLFWEARRSGQTGGRSMRRTIYSCTMTLEPKRYCPRARRDERPPTPPPAHSTLRGGIGGASLHAHGREAGVAFSGSTDIHFD